MGEYADLLVEQATDEVGWPGGFGRRRRQQSHFAERPCRGCGTSIYWGDGGRWCCSKTHQYHDCRTASPDEFPEMPA